MISSGAMYSGVPSTMPAPVIAVCEGAALVDEARTLATPKSLKNACPMRVEQDIPGFDVAVHVTLSVDVVERLGDREQPAGDGSGIGW